MEEGFAVKALIIKAGKILLIRRSEKDELFPETIDLPGGRLREGETSETGLAREVKEETGLEIEIIKATRRWTLSEKEVKLRGTTFYCKHLKGKVKLSKEHQGHEWVRPEEILEGDYPEWLKEEIKKAL